jgi:hypothetical protein
MTLVLKTVSGPHAGRTIVLYAGQTASVGRSERADFAFPDDACMSGVHFSLECQGPQCRLRDLQSTNGTLVNSRKVAEALVRNRDEIAAGQSVFMVQVAGVTAADDRPLPDAAERNAADSGDSAAPPPGGAAASPAVPQPATAQPQPAAAPTSAVPLAYLWALEDPDPAVRRKVLMAAAWAGEKWLLDYCRGCCGQLDAKHADAIHMAGILGTPEDLPRMLAVARAEHLGPRRFEVLASYGHPSVVEVLLEAIGGGDEATAAAASTAFTKITGIEIDFSPAGRPNLDRARGSWETAKRAMAAGTRYCRGLDLSRPPNEETLAMLDEESRLECHLRAAFEHARNPEETTT